MRSCRGFRRGSSLRWSAGEQASSLTDVDNGGTLSTMHTESHPLAGKTVTVTTSQHPQIGPGPHQFKVEDWWDKLTGGSWMFANGNPAATIYALRAGMSALPIDDKVVYGKIGHLGHLVHDSEFVEVAETP